MIHFVAVRRGKPARQAARSGRSSAGKENLGHELPYGKLALSQVLLCEKAQQKFLRFGPWGDSVVWSFGNSHQRLVWIKGDKRDVE